MPDEQHINDTRQADTLSPSETRHALWVAAIAWGVFGSSWASLISGAPFANFARSLGASTLMFGLLSSLPFLGVLVQLPASYLVERSRRRRTSFLFFASAQRATWFVVAALPWAVPSSHSELRVGILLGLVLLSSTMGHAGTPGWFSWFADIVPEEIRGRYLGQRQALATTTAVLVSALAGYILDRSSSMSVFTVMFAVAAVLGLTDIGMFLRVPEPRMAEHEGPPWRLRNVVLGPLASRPFRGYLLYAWSEALMFGLAGPFFWLMGLEVLEIGNFWSNLYIMLVPMICTAVALPLWGGIVDRFGAKPLVTLGTLVSIVFPVCWTLATPVHYHTLLGVAAVVGGIFGAAIQAADMNMIFALTPRRSRSAYIALVSVAASMGWVIAPTISGAIAQALKPWQLELGGHTFVNLHVLMALSIGARLLHVWLVVPRLPEEQRQSTIALAKHLVTAPAVWLGRMMSPRRIRAGRGPGEG